MRHEIVLAPEAVDDLRNLPAHHRSWVRDEIGRHLRHEPEKVSKSRIKKLRGLRRPQYRLRIGYIRVFYDVVGQQVEVLAVVPKSGVKEWLSEEGEKS